MKPEYCRTASFARLFGIFAILFPGIAHASPFTPGLVVALAMVMIWLILSIASLCNAKRWGWRIVLPICFSFPLLIGALYLYSVVDGVVEYWAREKYYGVCQAHLARATQILEVADVERPRSLIVDRSAEAFSRVDEFLADCVRRKETPACTATGLEFLEPVEAWYETESGRSRVCKGEKPCRAELAYYREDIAQTDNLHSSTRIERPVSDFVVRVGKKTDSGLAVSLFENAEKYVITIESARTGKVFAQTEILDRDSSPECPESADEIAKMIVRVFPSPPDEKP